jgi:hypothetical protein
MGTSGLVRLVRRPPASLNQHEDHQQKEQGPAAEQEQVYACFTYQCDGHVETVGHWLATFLANYQICNISSRLTYEQIANGAGTK